MHSDAPKSQETIREHSLIRLEHHSRISPGFVLGKSLLDARADMLVAGVWSHKLTVKVPPPASGLVLPTAPL